METTEALNGTFAKLAEGLQINNDAAMQVIADSKTTTADQMLTDTSTSNGSSHGRVASLDVPEPVKKKSGVPESGINTTLGNSQKYNSWIEKLGAGYTSSNATITTAALLAMYAQANASVVQVRKQRTKNKKTLKERYVFYLELMPLVTRIMNALKACGASEETLALARHFIKKLRGQRIVVLALNESNADTISACQTSFNNKLAHFGGLIDLLEDEPLYNPTVADLTVVALQARYDAMDAANTASDTAQSALDMALVERNLIFNEPTVGLVDVYQKSKNELVAIYGVGSGEFKRVKGLPFRKIDDR